MLDPDALRRWRERELTFPAFVRRMTPDALDMASGTWALLCGGAGGDPRPASASDDARNMDKTPSIPDRKEPA